MKLYPVACQQRREITNPSLTRRAFPSAAFKTISDRWSERMDGTIAPCRGLAVASSAGRVGVPGTPRGTCPAAPPNPGRYRQPAPSCDRLAMAPAVVPSHLTHHEGVGAAGHNHRPGRRQGPQGGNVEDAVTTRRRGKGPARTPSSARRRRVGVPFPHMRDTSSKNSASCVPPP